MLYIIINVCLHTTIRMLGSCVFCYKSTIFCYLLTSYTICTQHIYAFYASYNSTECDQGPLIYEYNMRYNGGL